MQLATLFVLAATVGLAGAIQVGWPGRASIHVNTQCVAPHLAELTPESLMPDSIPPDGPYATLRGYDTSLALGVGFLRSDAGEHYWEWHRHIRLPLFADPAQSAPFGWIADGWLINVHDRSIRPFNTTGFIETEYESSSAIVYEIRADGWVRFRYQPDEDGIAWTHECFFGLGDSLSVTTWEERLTSDYISPLFFRTEVPHALRAQPTIESERMR